MATKVCGKCGQEKDTGEFCKRSASPDGLQAMCKTCRIEYNTGRPRTARRIVYDREYYRSHRQERAEYGRQYYETHREHYRLSFQKYWLRNQSRWNQYKRQRRTAVHIPYTLDEVVDRCGLDCYLCGEFIEPGTFSLDHVVPISRRGIDTIDNVRPTHLTCNLRKKARLPDELPWYTNPLSVDP